MDAFRLLSVLALVALLPIYIISVGKLHAIIAAEHPEWLRYRGEPSVFYAHLPPRFDPNVSLRVVAIAFSARVGTLASPDAPRHARWIRIVLPVYLGLFAGIVWFALSTPNS
jgi:hypothetical protein